MKTKTKLKIIQISAVEQHISDKDELLSKMSALLEATNAQKSSVEESLTIVKGNLKEAEERVATLRSEIKKGNQIIATLQVRLPPSPSLPQSLLAALPLSFSSSVLTFMAGSSQNK